MAHDRTLIAHRCAGLVLLALGAGSLVESVRIRDDWSGARLLPLLVALALLALGAAHVATRRAAVPSVVADAGRDTRRVVLVVATLAAYVLAMPSVGVPAATATLVFVLVRALGGYRWWASAALGLAAAVVSHVVFRVWLGMPLPDGLLAR
jgi:hypothetical protein